LTAIAPVDAVTKVLVVVVVLIPEAAAAACGFGNRNKPY
jgi:hypothetical protein